MCELIPEENEDYLKIDYWNDRYNKEDVYDWCKSYDDFKHLINETVNKNSKILIIGCGNSSLSIDLYNDGFLNITSIDFSTIVIDKMREKCASYQSLKWEVMDMRELNFESNSFDIVIEKATIDVLLVKDKSPWTVSSEAQINITKTLEEIERVLIQTGKFLSITWAQPHFRRKLYEKYWNVEFKTFGQTFHYYFYIMSSKTKSNEDE